MAVKLAFIGLIPDADPTKHRCVMETTKYHLFIVMVQNQEQAIEACKKLANEEGIDQITFCPGYTYEAVGEIAKTVGGNVAIAVARRDGPSERL